MFVFVFKEGISTVPLYKVIVENPEAPRDFNIFLIGCIIVCHVLPLIVCSFKITKFIWFLPSVEKEFLFPSDLFPSQVTKFHTWRFMRFMLCYNILFLNLCIALSRNCCPEI